MPLQRHNTYYDSANPTSGVYYYDELGNILPLTIDKICHPGFGITFSANAIIATGSSSGSGGGSAYSPTVLIEDAGTPQGHPQGGTKVTITDINHQSGQEFYVWNGNNGTVMNLKEGSGIQITHETGSTNYTIGVSADYATKTYVDGQVGSKVDKPSSTQTGKLVYDSKTSAWTDIGLDGYVPYSAVNLAIGSGNIIETAYAGNSAVFLQGTSNTALNNSHLTFVQGNKNYVSHSQCSLLQGDSNTATNYYNFAQGALNDATFYSLTQGVHNTANNLSQAAGQANSAITASVAFGNANTAKDYSVAQGESNSAYDKTFAQGVGNSGYYCSFVQGYRNSAYNYGLAQGYQNTAEYESFAQGFGNYAGKNGECHALAQGYSNSAVYQSMAQGYMNTAYYDSFAQGFKNSAFDNSMAQGLDNTAHKFGAAIGEHNIAEDWSIAQGSYTNAYARSQAFGFRTIASGSVINGTNYGMMALGCCNATTAGALFVAGNGYLDEHSNIIRSDAFIIYRDGHVSAAGDIWANGVKLGAGGGTVYDIIGNNGISAKKDTANNRYEVGLSANVTSQLSKIDSKSTVTSGAGNVFTVNDTTSNPATNFTFSAVNYKAGQTAGYLPQQLFVVASDDEIVSLVHGGAADDKGCLFFRVQ